MSWLLANRRVAAVVALTLALPLALLLYALVTLCSLGLSFGDDIDTLEPRIARLLGAIQVQDELVAAAASAESTLDNLVYPAGDDPGAVSASLQKNVRELMSGAGLVVADSQIESARREGPFEVIGLAVSVTGSMKSVDAALNELVSYTPLLLVTDITMTPARPSRRGNGSDTDQVLSVKMSLIALVSVE